MPRIVSQLKQFRHKKNLTQEALAEALQVTRQTIHAIELGKYQPSLELAWRAARFFRVSIEEIFTFK